MNEERLKKLQEAKSVEDASGDGAVTYANILCVKGGNEAILALLEVLQSDEVAQFVEETYEGAVAAITGAEAETEEPETEEAAA